MQNGNVKLLSWKTTSVQFPNSGIEIDEDVAEFISRLSELPENEQEKILKVAEKLLSDK
ncbi:MAG: hypothetical protein MK132_25925 [Lentisphaerales bacterium]|nr:hypothetical protein [Lentisphaerales bacterium]